MKKALYIALCACLSLASVSNAQVGKIVTVAGGSAAGFAGDGLKATDPSVRLSSTKGLCIDASGNIYFADWGVARVRKVDAVTHILSTIAGGGSLSGPTFGDGGPATNAALGGDLHGLCLDYSGNIYIVDDDHGAIRKVNLMTGIISTIAGCGVGSGNNCPDGIPATSAKITTTNIYIDISGNIYFGDSAKIKMISITTGLISTFAGTTISGYNGDGRPATDAQIGGATSLTGDGLGNIYFSDDFNYRIRKINPSGIISTIAGNGTSGHSGNGGPALGAQISNGPICLDLSGNIYLNDQQLRKIDAATGTINAIAGCPSCGVFSHSATYVPDGVSTDSVAIDAYNISADAEGNIYYSDNGGWIEKVYNKIDLSFTTDSFSTFVNKICNGPELTVITPHYIAGRSVKTYFGDGTTDSSTILPGFGGGSIIVDHSYQTGGTYTISQVLYNSAIIADSLSFPYTYLFCRVLPIKLYSDSNGDCIKDGTEQFETYPTLTEVDSNGISVDTLSATSGFYYNAYCNPGDKYSFKFLNGPLFATCPATGIIQDTVLSVVTNYSDKYFGLTCPAGSSFDLQIFASKAVSALLHQTGNIYVRSNTCNATDATITLNFNPKYIFAGTATPPPTSFSGNTITWDMPGLSCLNPASKIFYALVSNPTFGPLRLGDTVQEQVQVTPLLGDTNPVNNTEIIIDTILASHDPNNIAVSPSGCAPYSQNPTQLQYTINFENTGTDTAFNIYIMDTLSEYVNPRSLRIVMASATMNITLLQNGNYNIARFDFPDINLLDSSASPAQSSGAVIYTINTQSNLLPGTEIDGHAGIFFDYNAAVLTNIATATIGGCTALSVPHLNTSPASAELYPNPATNELTIKTAQNTYTSFTITNTMGQLMMQQQLTQTQTKVDVTAIPPGLYYVMLKGDNASKVMKFVKM